MQISHKLVNNRHYSPRFLSALYTFSSKNAANSSVEQSNKDRGKGFYKADEQDTRHGPTFSSHYPPFNQLILQDIVDKTHFAIQLQLFSSFRWTPLLQKQDTLIKDERFQRKMREFSYLPTFREIHQRELTDALIFQALKDTEFDYYYDYRALPSRHNLFHGVIDFLIFNKKHEKGLPLVPVVMTKRIPSETLRIYNDYFEISQALGVGLWTLANMRAVNGNQTQQVHVLHTSGNVWRMYKIMANGDFEKTGFYEAVEPHKRIYRDAQAQSVALGLIRYALAQPQENEVVLKRIYDFVDERRYLTEIDAESKAKLNAKSQKFWWFLPRRLRDFLFKLQ